MHAYKSSRDPSKDHVAMVYGDVDKLKARCARTKQRRLLTNNDSALTQTEAVLCRIHSECFTGEVLGSLRCDCREQLQNAQRQMAAAGSGIIIYLRQEGRGIGLVNKLKCVA